MQSRVSLEATVDCLLITTAQVSDIPLRVTVL